MIKLIIIHDKDHDNTLYYCTEPFVQAQVWAIVRWLSLMNVSTNIIWKIVELTLDWEKEIQEWLITISMEDKEVFK